MTAPDVTADPFQVKHPQVVAAKLARVLDETPRSIKLKLTRKTRFVILASRVSRDQAQAVTALNLTGIYLNKNSKRFYPNRDLARPGYRVYRQHPKKGWKAWNTGSTTCLKAAAPKPGYTGTEKDRSWTLTSGSEKNSGAMPLY